MINKILLLLTSILALSCNNNTSTILAHTSPIKSNNMTQNNINNTAIDPHSFSIPTESKTTHLNLNIDVNFEKDMISGIATYNISNSKDAEKVVFDIKDLKITKCSVDEKAVDYEIKKGDEFGKALHIPIQPNSKTVSISYSTSPDAEAVQWLLPAQTANKSYPFLFTQGEAILTRTWIPIQDSPGIRISYDATVRVPKDMLPVMSATNPQEKNSTGEYYFTMDKAIPPYLIALAVGDIEFRSLGDRTGVYAESSVIDAAEYELADMEKMVQTAEGLYGDYVWGRFDVIVLPPSFPFGGMENPKLTFATPTIIVGDRSLTSLIAHELAHSWSGNLVTNSTWDDFWLNEGFTVYFEYRIMEALYGKKYANMLKLLGFQDLEATLNDPEISKEDTHLKLNLKGRNPDDGMTDIAYEKGHMFLEMLEEKYGREHFDEFLKSYFTDNAFKNMTTEGFIEILKRDLIEKYNIAETINYEEWIYGPGLPANCPKIHADQLDSVSTYFSDWTQDKIELSSIPYSDWSTQERLHFLREIPNDMTVAKMKKLDDIFKLTDSNNPEIQDIWYEKAVYTDYDYAYPAMAEFLGKVGRRKFLTPLYKAMKNSGKLDLAKKIYAKSRDQYHSVSTNTIDELLGVD